MNNYLKSSTLLKMFFFNHSKEDFLDTIKKFFNHYEKNLFRTIKEKKFFIFFINIFLEMFFFYYYNIWTYCM